VKSCFQFCIAEMTILLLKAHKHEEKLANYVYFYLICFNAAEIESSARAAVRHRPSRQQLRERFKDSTAAPAPMGRPASADVCAPPDAGRETEDRSMTEAKLSTALAAALAVATWTSQTLAAPKGSPATDRNAVVQRCMTEAKRHYGGIYYSWGEVREAAYGHCMNDAGLPP
jgi:hypothetical protein